MTTYSTAAKNTMLDALFSGSLYASMHSGIPDPITGSNELSGGAPAYARKPIAYLPAADGQVTKNATPVVTFDIPAGSSAAFVGLWDSLTGGTFLGYAPANGGQLSNIAMAYASTNTLFCPGCGGLVPGNQVVVSGINGALPAGLSASVIYTVQTAVGSVFTLDTTIVGDGPVSFQRVVADVFGAQGTATVSTSVFGFNG